MRNMLRRFARDASGATGIEYALLAAMLAIAVIGAVEAIHDETEASFTAAAAGIASGNTAPAGP